MVVATIVGLAGVAEAKKKDPHECEGASYTLCWRACGAGIAPVRRASAGERFCCFGGCSCGHSAPRLFRCLRLAATLRSHRALQSCQLALAPPHTASRLPSRLYVRVWVPPAVCIKVVEDVYQTVPEDQRKDRDAIESALGEYCKRGKSKLNSKERKACYYMVDIKRKVSDPLARGLPASRVCKKLKKANQELCEMRFRALPPPPSRCTPAHRAYSSVCFEASRLPGADVCCPPLPPCCGLLLLFLACTSRSREG